MPSLRYILKDVHVDMLMVFATANLLQACTSPPQHGVWLKLSREVEQGQGQDYVAKNGSVSFKSKQQQERVIS
jgi:hypothetical protein